MKLFGNKPTPTTSSTLSTITKTLQSAYTALQQQIGKQNKTHKILQTKLCSQKAKAKQLLIANNIEQANMYINDAVLTSHIIKKQIEKLKSLHTNKSALEQATINGDTAPSTKTTETATSSYGKVKEQGNIAYMSQISDELLQIESVLDDDLSHLVEWEIGQFDLFSRHRAIMGTSYQIILRQLRLL